MLVLGRSKGKSVVVGEGKDAVTVRVLDISPNHVRLGFESSGDIPIHRSEIYERIHGELPTHGRN